MKTLVFGAGPLGSLMAARLHEAGRDVTLLARGQRLKDLNEYGVVLETGIDGPRTTTPVKTTGRLDPDDPYDLIMVVMRKNSAVKILPTLAANKQASTVLFMMNNFAGPDEFAEALGKERVMSSFPYPGGERIGHVIRIVQADEDRQWTIPIGEVDGRIIPRTRHVAAFLSTMEGYQVEIRRDMDAWLKCHVVALVPALVPALYACDTDIERLARTRDALVLAARGIREGFRALRKGGVPLTPPALRAVFWIPEPLMVALLRQACKLEMMKISGEGHAEAARDEMEYLTKEFKAFTDRRGIETPVIDRLQKWYDPGTPPLPDGSSEIPMKKAGLGIAVAASAAFGALVFGLLRRSQDREAR